MTELFTATPARGAPTSTNALGAADAGRSEGGAGDARANGAGARRMARWPATLAFPLAAAIALAALGGICVPAVYARETASWAAQGVGQDWVNLVVVAPFLALAGLRARRGSRAFTLLLGGATAYVLYSYVLYAFALHFNALFLVYCAALGLSFFSLAGLGAATLREDVASWFDQRAPRRLLGGYLVASSVLFAALWLSEDVPALLRGVPPASLAEVGLVTNPVHVLDLSIVLPAMLVAGVGLLRRRSTLGWVLGPMMATFGVFMNVALVGMMVVLHARGLSADATIPAVFAVFTIVSLAVLIAFLRRLRPAAAT